MNTTSSPRTRLGRPADRQDLIDREIREQIVAGHLLPGSRLPTRDEIGQKYGAGANTVQRALDRLRVDGFIQSSGRNGTHVSVEPPHLTRYAVVFPGNPSQPHDWVSFFTALRNEAIRAQRTEGRKLPLYYGVHQDPTNDDYQALLADVLAHRVAGIVFASSAHGLVGSPILEAPGIPRVGIMLPAPHATFPTIYTDANSFLDRALKFLQERGCRKVAFINPPGFESLCEPMLEKIAKLGMETRPFWNQTVSVSIPYTARNLAHLLFHPEQTDRPDGLIISDDNLVEHATAGLLDAGVQVPGDIEVVAHCNFPWPTPSIVQVQRLGFDAHEVLQLAIDYIDALRRGESVAPVATIPARFENELLLREVTTN